MVYTPEEKQRMDDLLKVFGEYLASNEDVDVVYSEKIGYIRLILAHRGDPFYFELPTYDRMLEMFYFDILSDEVYLAREQNRNLTNQTMDFSIPYDRIKAYVDTMGADREYALHMLDKFIERWKNHTLLP